VPGHELVKDGGEFVQTVQMSPCQLLQYAVTGPGQADTNDAAIVWIWCPLNQPGGPGAVNELHRAVRPQEQVAGQIAYGGRPVSRVSLNRHKQLMLNMGQARGLRLFFAPVLKAPQTDAEFQQSLEVLSG
jgi:hypothetical protein